MFRYLIPAIILEGIWLSYLVQENAGLSDFFVYLLLHALASLLLSVVMRNQLAPTNKSQYWTALYVFVFNLVMPLVGVMSVAMAYAIARKYPAAELKDIFEYVPEPSFSIHRDKEGNGFRGGQVRAHLINKFTPASQKMAALLSIKETPTHVSKEILQQLLADLNDDVRLLAYGILDSKEKEIMQRIITLQEKFPQIQYERCERQLHHQLAELYWELIYQNLVQGDVRIYCANQVRQHAGQALVKGSDESLWFLLARLELGAGQIDAAAYYLSQARQCGFPVNRLLPYLAELHFLQKRYDDLRIDLIQASFSGIPGILPVLNYWLYLPAHKRNLPCTVSSDNSYSKVNFLFVRKATATVPSLEIIAWRKIS